VADTTVYDYDATAHGGRHYRVTFHGENTYRAGICPLGVIERDRGRHGG
jgi:hypothetical protein